ncbi:hypothetical protein BC826DRAFT_417849 [Russula brevipes]|nr:hypothetical protein BC826DRAFT_417849 [Russula brevipes]
MSIGAISSTLFGLICEASFHGCYTILFTVAVYLMVKRSRDWTSVISVFLYLSCTALLSPTRRHVVRSMPTKNPSLGDAGLHASFIHVSMSLSTRHRVSSVSAAAAFSSHYPLLTQSIRAHPSMFTIHELKPCPISGASHPERPRDSPIDLASMSATIGHLLPHR